MLVGREVEKCKSTVVFFFKWFSLKHSGIYTNILLLKNILSFSNVTNMAEQRTQARVFCLFFFSKSFILQIQSIISISFSNFKKVEESAIYSCSDQTFLNLQDLQILFSLPSKTKAPLFPDFISVFRRKITEAVTHTCAVKKALFEIS